MDSLTLKAYSDHATRLISSYTTMKPRRMYELVATFFHRNAVTLDVGCGSGRDLSFLQGSGFKIEGLDAVPEFVEHCRKVAPSVTIHLDRLPKLATLPDGKYDNVLVAAVLMHLPSSDLIEAAMNLLRITRPGGRLIISTKKRKDGSPERDDWGRLHSLITPGRLILLMEGLGAKLLFQEEQADDLRPEISWDNFVFEKRDLTQRTGIEALQEIITKDKKDTSYKLALLRSLCHISRLEHGSATFDHAREYVWIPMKRVSFYWLKFYFPLLKGAELKQSKSHPRLAFQSELEALNYGPAELARLISEYDDNLNRPEINKVLKTIADTIYAGPMQYIGETKYGVFMHLSGKEAHNSPGFKTDYEMGMMGVPVTIWHDLMLFGTWVEDSILMRWAEFTEKINPSVNIAEIFKLLNSPVEDIRTTNEVRHLFAGGAPECVWTGKASSDFQVDHAIPYSFWKNNDLWNLFPASAKVNLAKSDSIPHPDIVRASRDRMVGYWELYAKAYPERFKYQLEKAHRISGENWENELYLSFLETVTRLGHQKVVGVWSLA